MVGVSLNSVYRWEHDLVSPRKSMMKKIASLYEVPLEWLLQESTEENIKPSGDVLYIGQDVEQQLLRFFRKLTDNEQYKILGYVERIWIESTDKELDRQTEAEASVDL